LSHGFVAIESGQLITAEGQGVSAADVEARRATPLASLFTCRWVQRDEHGDGRVALDELEELLEQLDARQARRPVSALAPYFGAEPLPGNARRALQTAELGPAVDFL
jgi:hypothetical protein